MSEEPEALEVLKDVEGLALKEEDATLVNRLICAYNLSISTF